MKRLKSEQGVPAKSQKIFIKKRLLKQEIRELYTKSARDPKQLFALLESDFPRIYHQDVGVREGYTLKQHVLMVLRQFEKYFGKKTLPGGVDSDIFRIILALHDVGKPKAIKSGGKHLQHRYTQHYIKKFFHKINIDEHHIALALALTTADTIGHYLRGWISITQALQNLLKIAKSSHLNFDDFFDILCIFFKVDAGSYTENAGGIRSLDDLFIFDERMSEIRFAPTIQAKIDALQALSANS